MFDFFKSKKPVKKKISTPNNKIFQGKRFVEWWSEPVQPNSELPELEGFDTNLVMEGLKADIANGKLEVITMPDKVVSILQFLESESWDYQQIVAQLEQSPGITADFLSVANSTAFNRGVKISSLGDALPRLGRETIKAVLFINTSKASMPRQKIFQEITKSITDHSTAVGRVAAYLSPRFKIDANHAFLAGLLHDIGKLALIKQLDMHYEIPKDIKPPYHESLFNNIFEELHEEAGQIICDHWGLEDDVLMAIKYHHDLRTLAGLKEGKGAMKTAALIQMSDMIVRILGKGMPHEEIDLFKTKAARIAGLQRSDDILSFLEKIPDIVAGT
ncbi:MAG: HDOD domain-containing protein [Lentisphaeraceae bacterium]|nr:HDOD domain-containing protein [Lentisphaeraceae bacterium]